MTLPKLKFPCTHALHPVGEEGAEEDGHQAEHGHGEAAEHAHLAGLTAHTSYCTMLPKVKKQNLLEGTFWSSF